METTAHRKHNVSLDSLGRSMKHKTAEMNGLTQVWETGSEHGGGGERSSPKKTKLGRDSTSAHEPHSPTSKPRSNVCAGGRSWLINPLCHHEYNSVLPVAGES